MVNFPNWEKIIFIDDDIIVNLIHKKIFEIIEFKGEVLDFNNGFQAFNHILKQITINPELDLIPALIILDLEMPVLNGWEFLNFSKDPKRLLLLDDDRVDGNILENLDLTFDPYKAGDAVTVRQQSISQNFYKFLMDVYMQALTQENFFDSPSYNPISNLNSDIQVVGYFSASSYVEASIIIGED